MTPSKNHPWRKMKITHRGKAEWDYVNYLSGRLEENRKIRRLHNYNGKIMRLKSFMSRLQGACSGIRILGKEEI